MKAIKQLPLAAFLLASSLSTSYASDVLTGDTRLACEALLCLSSSTRPSECSPSLSRYFGISFPKKPWKTIEERINFLNMCPASNEPNMPSLIQAIANGAGKCDAEHLNQYNRQTVYKTQCTTSGGWWNEDNRSCTTTEVSVVSTTKPAYCQVYENHEYTDLHVKYVGNQFTGGFWAEGKDYERALQQYNDHYQPIPKGVTYSVEHPNVPQTSSGRFYERDSR